MEIAKKKKFDFFNYDHCTICGECLVRCQYLKLTKEKAVEEKKRLIEGKPSEVMKKCISCYACNAFCPNDCHPYELITGRWYQRYREKGLPIRANYLMPSSFPNFRTDMVKKMNSREQELIRRWKNTPPEGNYVLYPGCNTLALPHLLNTPMLDGVIISGAWDLCCGEMFFRMGLYDEVERNAEKLSAYYQGKNIGTMLFNCPACMNMFSNVLPQQFGAEFSFNTKYLGSYLLEKMESGELSIKKKLDRKVTLHDSCHARIMGDEVMETARQVFKTIGIDIVEMESNRGNGLCCGAAAGANSYNPLYIFLVGLRELWQGQRTGAKEFALYCGGCNITFNICRWLSPTRQPVRHLMEYVREAAGEKVYSPSQKRSVYMLLNIIFKALPRLLSPRSYRIDE